MAKTNKAEQKLVRWFRKDVLLPTRVSRFHDLLTLASQQNHLYDSASSLSRFTLEACTNNPVRVHGSQMFVFSQNHALPQFKAGIIYFPEQWLREYSQQDLLNSLYSTLYDIHGPYSIKTSYLKSFAESFKHRCFVFPLAEVLLFQEQLLALFIRELEQAALGIQSSWFKEPVNSSWPRTFRQLCLLIKSGSISAPKVYDSYMKAYHHV